jgi:apolipoprotein N-acyltransferase
MRADRWLLLAVLVLGCGLWVLFAYCHGTAGLAFALPVSGSSVMLDLKTTGAPVLIGIPLVALGVVLLLVAIVPALLAQFRRPERTVPVEKPAATQPPVGPRA